MEILSQFGIDWRLFTIQVINFGILLFVLHKFLYAPILRILERRRISVEESMAEAEHIKEERATLEKKKKEELASSQKKSQELIARAEEYAATLAATTQERARADAAQMLADTQKAIAAEKQKIMGEVRGEIAELVVAATEKVLTTHTERIGAEKVVESLLTQKK